MKKTLAIVLAVVLALSAVASLAFIIGTPVEKGLGVEVVNIQAVDLNTTYGGVRAYFDVVDTSRVYQKDEVIRFAITIRAWNAYNHMTDRNFAETAVQYAVASETANLDLVDFSTEAAYMVLYVDGTPYITGIDDVVNGAFDYRADGNVYFSLIPSQIFPQEIVGTTVTMLQQLVFNQAALTVTAGNIVVPCPGYAQRGMDYVDYVVIISGVTQEAFSGTMRVDRLVSGVEQWAPIDDDALFFNNTYVSGDTVTHGAFSWSDNQPDNTFIPNDADSAVVHYASHRLVLSGVGYTIEREEGVYNKDAAATVQTPTDATVPVVRYDVFKYSATAAANRGDYICSLLTENPLGLKVSGTDGVVVDAYVQRWGADAIALEYAGAVVTYFMANEFVFTTAPTAANLTTVDALNVVDIVPAVNARLNIFNNVKASEIFAVLQRFSIDITRMEGWPIGDDQFTGGLAAEWVNVVSGTYQMGSVSIYVEDVDEGTEDVEVPVDEEPIDDTNDMTIAFVCAAAAIVAVAALVFVTKKAR